MRSSESSSVKLAKAKEATIKALLLSAPNNGSKLSVSDSLRRSSSSIENKVRSAIISSERLTQLRKCVDDAIREHKTFTIKGGWQTVRNQFLGRGWVEKLESFTSKQKALKESPSQILEDVCINLPPKQDWESQAAYIQKCEKTIMSRMLQNHSVDFYWNMRRESSDWHHRINTNQTMNRFIRSLYTSKEGLNLLLQQLHWHAEYGVAWVNFPRCYTLGFPDHFNNFIDDFRITACISLLKWFTHKYETEDEFAIMSPEGQVSAIVIQFAIDRCEEYVAVQKHFDIDREFIKVWNHEWDQFLSDFYSVVHEHALLCDTDSIKLTLLNASARNKLIEIRPYWPMFDIDGSKNIWILKPGNKCRGRGIQLVKHLEDVAKVVTMKLKYVVQKYIERPLLIYRTKFDIRQWFMITSVQPLNIWMYKECYLRFSTQIFNLENFHESLHLTNHAVQCKYANVMQRDKALPDENMWDSTMFKSYLKLIGAPDAWDTVIYSGMRESIIGTMLACQDTMDRRPNTFELYGADFVLAEDFKPWLLEINACPDLSPSTSVTSRMCPQCLRDVVKVVVDKRRDTSADTGLFELVYRQVLPRPPAYLGMSLSIRGRRIFKAKKSKLKEQKDKDNKEKQEKKVDIVETFVDDRTSKVSTKHASPNIYKGPIIGDLIEEISQKISKHSQGYEFIPALPRCSTPPTKRSAVKNERVPNNNLHKNKTNTYNLSNRKQNVKENCKSLENNCCKPRSLFVKSAYFGLFHEWKMKNKFSPSPEPVLLTKNCSTPIDTSSILQRRATLSKFNIQKLSNSAITMNKKNVQIPYCLSSVNLSLSLPQLSKVEPEPIINKKNSEFENDNSKANFNDTHKSKKIYTKISRSVVEN